MVICAKCGLEYAGGARFCGKCGGRLGEAPPPVRRPPAEEAAAFEQNPTKAAPDTVRQVLAQARHPTAVLTGVAQASVEAELARAAAEFEDGATQMDPGLADRLQQARGPTAPADGFSDDAPTRMVDSSQLATPVADDFEGDAPTRVVDSTPAAPVRRSASSPVLARPVAPAPAPAEDLAALVDEAAGGFGPQQTGMRPLAFGRVPAAAAPPPPDQAPPGHAGRFPWRVVAAAAAVVLCAGGAVLWWLAGMG
ncbi:MAG: zinc ribbon domain-containing protein [Deltaproteobacteria bacterium]|nr:zinc ribbon domain-containing protein [Deltaproteobacteria bacterium]